MRARKLAAIQNYGHSNGTSWDKLSNSGCRSFEWYSLICVKGRKGGTVGVLDNHHLPVIVILKLGYSSLRVEIVTDGVRPMCGF